MLCSSPSQNWGCFFQFYSWIFLSSISWLIWPHTLCVGGGYLHLLTIDMMKYFSKRWNIFRWRGPSWLRGRERRWPSEHHERRQQCKRRRGDHHHLETPLPGRQTIGQTLHMQQNMSVFTTAFLSLNISHNDIIVLRGCLSSSFNFTCPNNASFPGRCSKHALDYTTLWGVKIKICSNNKSPLKRSYWDNKIWSV